MLKINLEREDCIEPSTCLCSPMDKASLNVVMNAHKATKEKCVRFPGIFLKQTKLNKD